MREAKNQLTDFDIESPSTLIMMGLGLGYQLEMLLLNPQNRISAYLLIEHDLSIFYYFLEQRDWSSFLKDPRVKIVVTEQPQDAAAAAHTLLPQIMGTGIQFLEHNQSVQYYSSFYSEVYEVLRRFLRQAAAESEFLARHGALIQRNAIANIPSIQKSIGLLQYQDALKNQPAILIAAGPSLTKTIQHLKEFQDQLFIFCVDTAYRIVLQHGITPDFVAATDPTELNKKHFEGIFNDPKSILLFESDVYPSIPIHWSGEKIFINSDKAPINQWIESVFGPFGYFQQSLSVAHALFTAATYMGCSPIILTGFDLAYTREEGETHARGTALNRKIEKAHQADTHLKIFGSTFHPDDTMESITWVTGMDGDLVPTSKTMAIFLNTLSESIQKTKIPVFDATEGGALIHGSIPTGLQDILQDILSSTVKKTKKPNIHVDSQRKNKSIEPIHKALIDLNNQLTQAIQTAQTGLEIVKKFASITSIASKRNLSNSQEWNSMDTYFWEVYRNLATQTILSQALFPAMFMFIRQEKNESDRSRLRKYANVFEAVIRLGREFQKLLDKIRNQIN